MAWIQMMRNRFPFRNILMMTNLLVLFSDGSTAPFPPFFQPLCLSGVLWFSLLQSNSPPSGRGVSEREHARCALLRGEREFFGGATERVCVCVCGREGVNGLQRGRLCAEVVRAVT